jgi:DNA-binding MarR family transcriptional regulator
MNKTRTVTDREYETLAALRHSLRLFFHFSETAAHGLGLTPQQHQALLAIKGSPKRGAVSIGDLAEHLLIRHHSAVELADRLVRNNLVVRKQDIADRRKACLALTRRGEKVLEKLSSAHKEQLHRIGPQIEALLKELRRKARR